MYASRGPLVLFLLYCCQIFCGSYGGSHCPPRKDIYPCICINAPNGKRKVETIVVCQNLKRSNNFIEIESALQSMSIEKFFLYDSFGESDSVSRGRTSEVTLPMRHFSSYDMKEVEIVDTIVPAMRCSGDQECSQLTINKLTIVNSSIASRDFTDTCTFSTRSSHITSWVSCFNSLKFLKISHGNIQTLKIGNNNGVMKELRELRLSNNGIQRIDDKTFIQTALPKLHILDLSFNSIAKVKDMFASEMKIEHLDLSFNPINHFPKIPQLPKLRVLNISNTNIMYMHAVSWPAPSKSLRIIDLTGNLIECDCKVKWVNGSFHVHTNILGTCNSPVQLIGMKIRRASRYLLQRCDEKGNIAPKA